MSILIKLDSQKICTNPSEMSHWWITHSCCTNYLRIYLQSVNATEGESHLLHFNFLTNKIHVSTNINETAINKWMQESGCYWQIAGIHETFCWILFYSQIIITTSTNEFLFCYRLLAKMCRFCFIFWDFFISCLPITRKSYGFDFHVVPIRLFPISLLPTRPTSSPHFRGIKALVL